MTRPGGPRSIDEYFTTQDDRYGLAEIFDACPELAVACVIAQPRPNMNGHHLGNTVAVSARLTVLANVTGINLRTIQRYASDGMAAQAADRLATALDLHPLLVWPTWELPGFAELNDKQYARLLDKVRCVA